MKLVKIKWYDANMMHGWQSDSLDCELAICEEVGWILSENESTVLIVRGISNHGFHNSPMAIPKGCIIETKELRVK